MDISLLYKSYYSTKCDHQEIANVIRAVTDSISIGELLESIEKDLEEFCDLVD